MNEINGSKSELFICNILHDNISEYIKSRIDDPTESTRLGVNWDMIVMDDIMKVKDASKAVDYIFTDEKFLFDIRVSLLKHIYKFACIHMSKETVDNLFVYCFTKNMKIG